MKRLVIAAMLAFVPSIAVAENLATVNGPAPMFRLPMYNPPKDAPNVLGLDRFVGPDANDKNTKVVLLSFMASFCAPCKKEMPYLQKLHEKYQAQGLRVVMVSIDTEPAGQKIIDELIAKNKVTYPVLKDRFNLVARRWLGSQSPLPSVFMIRPDGTISALHRGYNEEASATILSEVELALGIQRAPNGKAAIARP